MLVVYDTSGLYLERMVSVAVPDLCTVISALVLLTIFTDTTEGSELITSHSSRRFSDALKAGLQFIR